MDKQYRAITASVLSSLLLALWAPAASPPRQMQSGDVQQWTVSSHDNTDFPLVGKHRTVECRDCHLQLVFEGTPRTCEACHWERRQDDRYELHLGSHCADCHTPYDWKMVAPNKWNHETVTGFILLGTHHTLDCIDCHQDRRFLNLSGECFSCHEDDYRETREPDHAATGFPLDCQFCHTSNITWKNAVFSHELFLLGGRHLEALCTDCHGSGRFQGLSQNCSACHLIEYRSTSDPDHQRAGFPVECAVCHGNSYLTWAGAEFTHSAFSLQGRHAQALCSDCHSSGIYSGLPSDCVSCHLNDYNSTDDPDHQELGFSTDCEICHGTAAISWAGAEFTHSAFLLLGRHAQALCLDCHDSGIYSGLPSDCVSCHLNDYNSADDPDHQELGFSTDCEICHGTAAISWEGAIFDHNSEWPLQGAHTSLSCSACHISGVVLTQLCFGCHADDYRETLDPDHEAAEFPTDCELCHYPSHIYWTQAVFEHGFPITSGHHGSLYCTECHLTPNYREFACIECHAHNQTKTNKRHNNVAGYTYNSIACYSCHTQGQD